METIYILGRLPKNTDLLLISPTGKRKERKQSFFETLLITLLLYKKHTIKFFEETQPETGKYQLFLRRYGNPRGEIYIVVVINGNKMWIKNNVQDYQNHQDLIIDIDFKSDIIRR